MLEGSCICNRLRKRNSVTKADKEPNKKLADFFRLIAAEADHFPVELIELTGKKGVQGVMAFDSGLSAARKRQLHQLVSSLSSRSQTPAITLLDKETGLPGKAGFLSQADAEIHRVRKSRLPCSLLLIQLSGKKGNNGLKKLSSTIKKESQHYLARFDHNTLALLLPGASKSRAVKKAHVIHKALITDFGAPAVSIGHAICLARNVITTADFIERAAEQLQRAKDEGPGVFYASQELKEDSCQVTAEERTHLFKFLRG